MKLSTDQMKEAMAATRKLIAEHTTMFLDYNRMVSDAALEKAITQILSEVTEEVK